MPISPISPLQNSNETPVPSPAWKREIEVRKDHLGRERGIKTLGACFAVAGILPLTMLMVSIGFGILTMIKGDVDSISKGIAQISVTLLFAVPPLFYLIWGNRIKKLSPASRVPGIIMSLLICIAFFLSA